MRRTSRSLSLFILVAAALCAILSPRLYAQEAPKIPEGVEYQADIEYGTGGDLSLHLDIAQPIDTDGLRPCVVFIHGGAWRAGDKKAHTQHVLMLAKRGYVSATVQYRFCPQHTFPAQIEDVKCAVRYLRAHAEKWNIDPERIGAVGFSAGAHLSMMLGTMQAEDGFEGEGGWADRSSKAQAVVSFAGPTQLGADDLPVVSQTLVKDFLGGTKEIVPDQYEAASPITYVTKGDAPHLLFQGTKDELVPHTQATAMADALTKAEVPGRIELLIGAGHGWGGVDQERSFAEMNAFLDRHLNHTAPEGK